MHKYLVLDNYGEPIAHAWTQNTPTGSVWQLQVEDENIHRVMACQYINLIGMSEKGVSMEGHVIGQRGNMISVEPIRSLGEEVRKNLRVPVRFESFLYPISGNWKGRAQIISYDLSCGGIAFSCDKPLEIEEIAQVVIPVTTEPLLLNLQILRKKVSVDTTIYAAQFIDMVHEEEVMVREAVFSLQLQFRKEKI